MTSGGRLSAISPHSNPAASARGAVHGPVSSSRRPITRSSAIPCSHNAWLPITHVVVPKAYASVSSSAIRGVARRRSNR